MAGAQLDDATWAPQSPNLDHPNKDDLDDFVHPQHRGFRGSISHSLPYSPPESSPPPLLASPLPVAPPTTNLSPAPAQPAEDAWLGMPRGVRSEESMQDADYMPETDVPQLATDKARGKAVKREEGAGNPTPDVNITVHFPVARIKRIMQADDDVGKVAQVTPVVVCTFSPTFLRTLRRLSSKKLTY